jgi:hypothetical protein
MLVSLIITTFSACAKTNPWQGKYSYEGSSGKNLAEDEVIVEYTFKYSPTQCEIQIEGYQVSDTIQCNAHEANNSFEVTFKSYNNGSTKNIYEVEVYPIGSKLFTLTSKDNTTITMWGELKPDGISEKSGKYFIKHK